MTLAKMQIWNKKFIKMNTIIKIIISKYHFNLSTINQIAKLLKKGKENILMIVSVL